MSTTSRLRAVLICAVALLSIPLGLAQTITPAMAVPAGSVDTNAPGFKMRVVQGNSSTPMSGALPAEGLISGRRLDPATGLPLNNATPEPVNGTYTYIIDKYINYHEQVPNNPDVTGGNFYWNATAPMNVRDEALLGIPGVGGSGDYYVLEFTGYLQLPAGTVRFGVNSDDGFKLTIGTGIHPAVPNLQLIILDGTRGFGNTEANITVTQAGIYPFRLLFWEQTGLNSGVEFYTFAPGSTSGNRYLVNDRNQTSAIKAYRELVDKPPVIVVATPALTTYVDRQGNGAAVPPAPYMWLNIMDGATTLNADSIRFLLDNTALTHSVTKDGSVTTIGAQSPILVAGSAHTNTLIYADSAGKTFTNSWPFTVSSYAALPAAYALPSADTSKPGFRAKVYQIDYNRNPATGQVPNAERQIAGDYRDPGTHAPMPNTAMTDWMQTDGTVVGTAGADGYFTISDVINWNQDAPTAAGNFSVDSTPANEDKPVPGITGNTGPNTTDRAVFSIETILELKAGAYRFGVNSDDGFRLSAGRGPGDVVGLQLGTAGDRSAVDSYMDFLVSADGFYPFRLMWFETSGGASCEWFVVDLATGRKTLINDLTGATPIKAYSDSAASRPQITKALPTVNYNWALADQDLVVEITDGAISLDDGSVTLAINNTAQTISTTKSGKVTTITRDSSLASLLPSGTNDVTLVYGFTEGGNQVRATNTWTFRVPPYTRMVPAANRVAASDVSGAGFHVRAHQLDRSKDSNQGNGGRYTGNNGGAQNMPRLEIQLTGGYLQLSDGQPYPNLASQGPNADGSFDFPEVLNWNNSQATGGPAANVGIFNGDVQVAGLPGGGTSNFGLDNNTHEILTYLELKAGAYVFGMNVDDAWVCYSSPNARDTLGTLLGWRNAPGGQNGNPLNNPNAAFNVIVPEDGIYPFRILFANGGGGVNLEFLAVDPDTGTQVLVNDLAGAFPSTTASGGNLVSLIKAYSAYTGPVRPWTKFSVYPPPTMGTYYQFIHQQTGPGPITVRVGSGNPADIANDEPRPDQALVNRPFGDAVGAIVADLGAASVGMVLDGASVTPTVTDVPGTTDKLVLYTPNPRLASGSTHTAGLVYAGTTNYWTFTVISYANVPAGIALPPSAADTSAVGFRAKVVQALTSTTLANTVARAEAQLAGTPANVAAPGPEPDGSYIIPGIINWNVTKNPGATLAEIGNFQTARGNMPDQAVPGIPGAGTSGNPRFENITAEVFAYLDLPAGYQKFGVNGDDGWAVSVAGAGVTNGVPLFARDRSAGARDIPIAFVTPEAGLYPIRLVWYQGNGGGNLEFFSYGPNNEKIPVNAPNNPNAIKAYYKTQTQQPPNITSAGIAGGSITVEWTGGGTLESSPDVTTGWTSTGDSDGSFTEAASGAAKFYRVKR